MLYEVKIWGKELHCDICSTNQWHKNTLKTEFENDEDAWKYSQEVRYMFECNHCGNCRLFGMVISEEDIDEVNIIITPIEENIKNY